MTDCTSSTTLSRKLKKRSIHVNFDGGDVSSIGGTELMRAADDLTGLCKSASKLLPDHFLSNYRQIEPLFASNST